MSKSIKNGCLFSKTDGKDLKLVDSNENLYNQHIFDLIQIKNQTNILVKQVLTLIDPFKLKKPDLNEITPIIPQNV